MFAFTIANTLIHASRADNTRSPRREAFGNDAPAGDSINNQACLEYTTEGKRASIPETDWYRSR